MKEDPCNLCFKWDLTLLYLSTQFLSVMPDKDWWQEVPLCHLPPSKKNCLVQSDTLTHWQTDTLRHETHQPISFVCILPSDKSLWESKKDSELLEKWVSGLRLWPAFKHSITITRTAKACENTLLRENSVSKNTSYSTNHKFRGPIWRHNTDSKMYSKKKWCLWLIQIYGWRAISDLIKIAWGKTRQHPVPS